MNASKSGLSALVLATAVAAVGCASKNNHKAPDPRPLTPEAFIAVQAGLAARPDSTTAVETIDRPVLAIAGGQDTAIDPADMEAFRRAPGGCEFHLIENAGHFAAYEQPRVVAELLGGWMKQISR